MDVGIIWLAVINEQTCRGGWKMSCSLLQRRTCRISIGSQRRGWWEAASKVTNSRQWGWGDGRRLFSGAGGWLMGAFKLYDYLHYKIQWCDANAGEDREIWNLSEDEEELEVDGLNWKHHRRLCISSFIIHSYRNRQQYWRRNLLMIFVAESVMASVVNGRENQSERGKCVKIQGKS